MMLGACMQNAGESPAGSAGKSYSQSPQDLLVGEVMAVAYSGFREGQHPDRGSGAVNPGRGEILEDLQILDQHGFGLIRLYDAGENSRTTLELIREHGLQIKVLQGIWLDAEISNHEGCPWLDEPIPEATLAANVLRNEAEIRRGIELAQQFDDIVVAVNVGNEALVEWNDHMVPLAQVVSYVRQVKAEVAQPVTVADNYEWWIADGAPLAAEVDFIGVHTYPAWEEKTIDEALAYTIENIEGVRRALPDRPIAILEAGWATVAEEFGDRASEAAQARYYRELGHWAAETNTTVFFFEAFDEPWKGDADRPLGAEKHWGMWNVDRTPKQVVEIEAPPPQNNVNASKPGLTVLTNNEVDPGGTLTLVWSDEFDGAQLDPQTWFFETGDGSRYGIPGWGNNELQYYLPDSARLNNGMLTITARAESIGAFNYTSARINTRDRFAFKYGRIEARMRLPAGQGLWPAFWMLPQDSPYGKWAASGEIDIMEAVNLGGSGGNQVLGTIQYGGEFPENLSIGESYVVTTDATTDFHVYAIEWDTTEIRWYVDDILYATQNSWSSTAAPYPAPFDHEFYLLFNVAVGGDFPGAPNAGTVFPVTMDVDWVRVYSGTP